LLVGAVLVLILEANVQERACAAEVSYSLGYRAEYSDNIRREAVNPEHDMANALQAGVRYQDRSRSLDLRLAPSVEYINYRKNTFNDEARLNLDSALLWTVSPERFTWTAEDTARQVRLDSTLPETPTNTATANLFATGPDLYLRAGSANTLQLGARYGDLYVSDTNLDNQRGLGYARWLYKTSPLTTWSLNLEEEHVRFDDQVANTNFRRQDLFLGIHTRSSQATAAIDVGRTRIARDRTEEVEGGLARLSWNRRLNTENGIGIVAESSLSDTGSDLAATAAAANTSGQTTSQNLIAQDIFRAKRAEVFLNRRGSRFTTDVRAFSRRLEFQIDPTNDRRERGGELAFGYLYSAATSIDVSYSHARTTYSNQALIDIDKSAGLSLRRLITRNVSMAFQLQQDKRNSTDPSRGFVANIVTFTLLYKSGSFPRR
jgi:hypothetical protein